MMKLRSILSQLGVTLVSVAIILGLVGSQNSCASEVVDDFTSPVTTDARWIVAGGSGLTLAILATQDSVSGPFEKSTAEHKPLGSASKFGDAMGQLVPNALYAGGMLIAHYAGNPNAKEYSKLMFEATVYASLITTALKYSIREPRPYDSSVRNSFPSGHATTAFAFAGVVATEHGWLYGVPAMLLASFVGYSRINDHQHYVHDVAGGATVGLAYAYGIYYNHRNSQEQTSGAKSNVQLWPIPLEGGGAQIALVKGW